MNRSDALVSILGGVPIIPVLTVGGVDEAVNTARALCAGGLPVIEVTLRTESALAAISAIRDALPNAVVGAGTVTVPEHFAQVEASGAQFCVSPAVTEKLIGAASISPVPWLPTASTPSEHLNLLEHGYSLQKLFPAEPIGGIAYLNAVHPPLPDVRFCPTGGINASNAAAYLACVNVACVGGSWVSPAPLVAAKQWDAIEGLARASASLGTAN